MNQPTDSHFLWIVFHERDVLLRANGDGTYSVPLAADAPITPAADRHIHCATLADGTQVRAFETDAPDALPPGHCFMPLRSSFECLPAEVYDMAGKMEELIYWDKHNRFCGVCGSPMKYSSPISKECEACGHTVWPQLQVAIIVLIKRGDEILLVQAKNFRGNYMGLVAGFVETGETLEQCVCREVMEETNLDIGSIRYFGSQPWPYPCGLMVGFVADYCGGTLKIQDSELNKGGWYSAATLPAIPGRVSLARRLIDAWLRKEI